MNARGNTTPEGNITPELPQESADALIRSMKDVVREQTGLEVGVRHEPLLFGDGGKTSNFIVTLPEGVREIITEEQWGEMDYWLREVCCLIEYANPPEWYRDVAAL